MNWQGPEFVLSIIAMSFAAWVVTTWIRARHGYAIEDEWGGKTERADTQATATLREENAELRARLARLEARTASIETIVTDSGYDTARQIDSLRAPRAVEDNREVLR